MVTIATNLFSNQVHKQPVGHELDVLAHELAVHAEQAHGQRVREELLLDDHRVLHDLQHARLAGLLHQVLEHQAREVGVETLSNNTTFNKEKKIYSFIMISSIEQKLSVKNIQYHEINLAYL